jgi:hypothetical protein
LLEINRAFKEIVQRGKRPIPVGGLLLGFGFNFKKHE